LHPPAATSRFESAVLDQLDAAHNLARWLVRNEQDAQDVVQESCMKALRAFDSLRGGDFRPWFLAIVRNTSFTFLSRNKAARGSAAEYGTTAAQSLDLTADIAADAEAFDPQALAIRAGDAALVRKAIDALPEQWREVLVLREMEGLSYKEIGAIVGVPIGTVMSRLARGRGQLQSLLMKLDPEGTLDREGTR
jgi:RNA polymerase sigma factor (sigma-70 family)